MQTHDNGIPHVKQLIALNFTAIKETTNNTVLTIFVYTSKMLLG